VVLAHSETIDKRQQTAVFEHFALHFLFVRFVFKYQINEQNIHNKKDSDSANTRSYYIALLLEIRQPFLLFFFFFLSSFSLSSLLLSSAWSSSP